ncbi:MAG: 23S rRNA (adenine(2030)-N(6))-methyltransferase RlmJ, partial [Bosea sp. (in: a-proteobacteria)]
MNYRHSFHAGNFADVMKHALLARILSHLNAKPAPWRCIDIHAGAGLYDLSSDEATRTGEWQGGIGLMEEPLEGEAEALLGPWRQAVHAIQA